MHTAPSRALALAQSLPLRFCASQADPRIRFPGAVQRRVAQVERHARISGFSPQPPSTFLLALTFSFLIILQILSHFVALVLTTVFLLDNWASATMWYIFGFFVAPTSAAEGILIISSLLFGKKKY
jgi:hypothetical protein